MSTTTQTYTQTDIRKVFECFDADLMMLAYRTQAMTPSDAQDYIHDIKIMARKECLEKIHIQLLDGSQKLIKAHEYHVEKNISWDSQRPGENRWPCSPNGTLCVVIVCSDQNKMERLKKSEELRISWGPADLSTDYSNMNSDTGRMYASNSYGLRRKSFTI